MDIFNTASIWLFFFLSQLTSVQVTFWRHFLFHQFETENKYFKWYKCSIQYLTRITTYTFIFNRKQSSSFFFFYIISGKTHQMFFFVLAHYKSLVTWIFIGRGHCCHYRMVSWFNLCACGKMYLIQLSVKYLVSYLWKVNGFLLVLWFPPQIKLTATI